MGHTSKDGVGGVDEEEKEEKDQKGGRRGKGRGGGRRRRAVPRGWYNLVDHRRVEWAQHNAYYNKVI